MAFEASAYGIRMEPFKVFKRSGRAYLHDGGAVKEVLELAGVHSCGSYYNPQPAPALPSSSGVSICTFVPAKQVTSVPERSAKEAEESVFALLY